MKKVKFNCSRCGCRENTVFYAPLEEYPKLLLCYLCERDFVFLLDDLVEKFCVKKKLFCNEKGE